ncbi:MAG: efflux RND transporter periplasmic adaptor subunit [Pirellulales bacterium]|nr:efflux RND transporter periplasmic adaptor subunit [Pirellulales bacterium]
MPSIHLRMKRLLPLLGGVLLLLGALAWMSGLFRSKISPGVIEQEGISAQGRKLVTVEELPIAQTIDVSGSVEARRKTEVSGQVLAVIREVKVRAGDYVEPGQSLVVLDDREIQAQLRESEAAAAGVKADLELRRRDYERYRQMLEGKAVSKEEFDRVRGAYQGAEAQWKRITEQIARVRVTLSYTEIKAQAAGIVARRHVDPGDLAAPGKPLLTLYDPNERELHADVPESLMAHVQLGAVLPVTIDAVRRTWEGTVREIVPQAQVASRSILVKVTLPPEAAEKVLIGMFGRLAIPVGQAAPIVIPAAAVRHVGQEDLVDVVDREGFLEHRFVRTGRRYGEKIEILSGLKVGEKVALPEE